MPVSSAVSSRPPRPSSEKAVKRDTDDYTFTPELAREWLGLEQAEMDALVKRSKRNASRGRPGPLVLVNGGQSYTMHSVFLCRRVLTATTH